jgi:geranylgeranyl diphosphate synthase type I
LGSGALARTERRIAALTDTALAALRGASVADDAADMLADLAAAATSRSQ